MGVRDAGLILGVVIVAVAILLLAWQVSSWRADLAEASKPQSFGSGLHILNYTAEDVYVGSAPEQCPRACLVIRPGHALTESAGLRMLVVVQPPREF